MCEPKISIIVPVYNVEKYLRECLDSLINQTLKNVEIICVNDTSTDGSLAILREYEKKDSRIVVLDQPVNKGLSAVRNVAATNMRGEYVTFVDSDDYVDEQLFEKALQKAYETNADMVLYDYAAFSSNIELKKRRKVPSSLASISSSNTIALLQRPAFACTKLIKTEAYRRLGIVFPEGLTYEDGPVHWKLVTSLEKIALLPERLYFYRQRKSSITWRRDITRTDFIIIYDKIYDYLNKNNLYVQYRSVFLKAKLSLYCNLYDHMQPSLKHKTLLMIKERLGKDEWQFISEPGNLPNKIRLFYQAFSGSRSAKFFRVVINTLRHLKNCAYCCINVLINRKTYE